eukprot:COSAG06_NODE_50245_length_320_cov_0.678733_1_plen_58_part_10
MHENWLKLRLCGCISDTTLIINYLIDAIRGVRRWWLRLSPRFTPDSPARPRQLGAALW